MAGTGIILGQAVWGVSQALTLWAARVPRLRADSPPSRHSSPFSLVRQPEHLPVAGRLQSQGSESWECDDMEAAESLFECLEQAPDPRRAS